jgi:hypothetical protein
LRKYLIVAVAAIAAVAFATVAFAQGGGPDTAELTVKVAPKKAGTPKKPKNVTYTLDVKNGNTNRTMSDLDVFLAKTVKLSLKGMPSCPPEDVVSNACPKSTELGHGEAKALVGVNGDSPTDLTFVVTAYKTKNPDTGKTMLGFFIDGGGQKLLTTTKLSKASGKYGQKLHIDVPEIAQIIPPSTYNGLVSLHTTLTKKVGKKYLVSTVGCKKKKHPYKVTLTFIDNPKTTAAKISDTANAKCTK